MDIDHAREAAKSRAISVLKDRDPQIWPPPDFDLEPMSSRDLSDLVENLSLIADEDKVGLSRM